jgi:hypothetical protein
MQAFGMLLLAAATAGDGFGYQAPGVGLKKWLRPHVEATSDITGAPPFTAQTLGAAGGGGGAANGRRFTTTKSQVYFLDPDKMQVGWQTASPTGERVYPPPQLVVPARYNFNQGYIYRLKITNIPGRPNATLYPSIEVAPSTPITDAYLAHNAIPIQFTTEDFDQVVDGGNFVTKVIYLPDPKYQELAVSGVETLVSTRLEPGVDPILEADKRGTILLILRLGAIDLEMQGSSPSILPGSIVPSGTATELAPATLPPGVAPATRPAGTVILDQPPAGTPPPAPGAIAPPATPAPAVPATPVPAVPRPGTELAPPGVAVPATALAPSPEPPAAQIPAAVPPSGN